MTKKEQLQPIYENSVNQVINYIEQNLSNDLSLNTLAKIANISPYHFHRIFSLICGETIHQFVIRKRIEKIASILINKKFTSISALSYNYGFDNPTSFSRAFKNYYGISASSLIKKTTGSFKKIIKHKSKNCKEPVSVEDYICNAESIKDWSKANAKINIVNSPELKLAYLRHKGSFYQTLDTFKRLKRWADNVKSLNTANAKWLMLVHDNPAVASEELITQSAGILIGDEFYDKISVEYEVSKMTIPSGKFLKGEFNIHEKDFKNAWDAMSICMIENNYLPRDGYYFELFHTNSLFLSAQKHLIDIYISV